NGFDARGTVVSALLSRTREKIQSTSQSCSTQLRSALDAFAERIAASFAANKFAEAKQLLQSLQQNIQLQPSTSAEMNASDKQLVSRLQAEIVRIGDSCPSDSPELDLQKKIRPLIPTFVYMDDYRAYSGRAFLDQLKSRRDQRQATNEDETVLTIMEMAGLSL